MRIDRLRIVIWILLGLALRAVALDGNGLWMDEGYTAWTAHLPAEAHANAVRNDDAPPLYYAIQRAVLPHLPPDETSIRLLSAAAGVAGIVWLAVCPPIRGVVGAPVAFYALGTYGVYYGRQARSYALLILWGLVLLTATSRALEGRRRWFIAVALSEALALWTHNVAIHLVLGANAAWLICGRRQTRGWLVAQTIALLLWSPQLLRLLTSQFAIHETLNLWVARYWEAVPLALGPLLSLASFTSGAWVKPVPYAYRWTYHGTGYEIVTLLALMSVVVLLLSAFRRAGRRDATFAAAFTLVPLVSLACASAWVTPSYTLARTDTIAYGGFLLWTALGLRRMPRAGRTAIVTVLALSSVLATAEHFPVQGRQRENDRLLGRQLRAMVRPGDWIAYVGASRPSIDYYTSDGRPGRSETSLTRVSYPSIFIGNPASDYPTTGDSLRAWEREAWEIRRRFEESGGTPDRTFYWVGPIEPGKARMEAAAQDLYYPGNMLAYVVNGLRPFKVVGRARGDELSVDWLIFRIRHDELIPQEELEEVIRAD